MNVQANSKIEAIYKQMEKIKELQHIFGPSIVDDNVYKHIKLIQKSKVKYTVELHDMIFINYSD